MAPMNRSEYERLAAFYSDRVRAQDAERPGYAAAWATLTEAVLAHGGELVVPPTEPEAHLELIGQRLATWPGAGALLVEGEPSRCHGNSAALWLEEQVAGLVTGYALSEDGLWRQHSWALAADGTVVETTVARDVYAGAVLTDVEAVVFAAANVDEETFTKALVAGGRVTELAMGMLEENKDRLADLLAD